MAENDGKLYIIITDKYEGGNGAEPEVDVQTKTVKQSSDKKGLGLIEHQYKNFIIGQAKQFVSYNINNIGNFSGDYIAQRKVNEAVQGLNIGLTIAAGFKVGGVPGALIATAGIAINAAYESKTQRIENSRTNYNIEQLRRRSGLNIYLDGSRGTEN